ncbi:methylated-DNA--[protein]-cysteine S-methyltransferase [Pseudohalocynthiibacter aestuariivivens]|uniref:Methylated-DNA--protein-cysteine methyltransferase n=1 Tax=Roseovarius pelagicus TaxID=2980108 RepID=A0ABY6DF07_9RHOB|nr:MULTISPECIES: methylated-DNA--[protein]-cysteine S-methyltransferase [Rhodobacterales]QIE46726.1 methylated-DNA--[protein]-cysteine S-methyltransferase [Pseudohalocynthiibacter aestuariivivens]UXX84736.1 methylated-DNA--[protein]-cysteine S-methyltransferase [Roseovarius pelagicus]
MPAVTFSTPIGPMTVVSENADITAIDWRRTNASDSTPELEEARRQITAYFDGTLTVFDLPLRVGGTDFQRDVCDQISAIPYGETRTYGEIASALGVPAQAVGSGCGGNPIPVIIPCHRVLGANGLGGFSARGGVETKVWLLKHEGAAGLLI